MSGRPQQTPRRRRRGPFDDHRLRTVPGWETELLSEARRQHDTTRTEEADEPC